MDSRYWIPADFFVDGTWIPGFQQIVSGWVVPNSMWAVFHISKSKIPNSMAKICWIPDSTSKNFLDSKIPPILLHGAEGRPHDLVFFFLTFLTQTTLLHFTTALVKTVFSRIFCAQNINDSIFIKNKILQVQVLTEIILRSYCFWKIGIFRWLPF